MLNGKNPSPILRESPFPILFFGPDEAAGEWADAINMGLRLHATGLKPKAINTLRAMALRAARLATFAIGRGVKIEAFDRLHWDDFVALARREHLQKHGRSRYAATEAIEHQQLYDLFQRVVDRGLLGRNPIPPMADGPRDPLGAGSPRPWRPSGASVQIIPGSKELVALRATLSENYQRVFDLLLATAARWSEMERLVKGWPHRQRISGGFKLIVEGKGNPQITLIVPDSLIASVDTLCQFSLHDENGKPITRDRFNYRLRLAAELAGISPLIRMTAHKLRHISASYQRKIVRERGGLDADLAVSRRLNHRHVRTTLTYLHPVDANEAETIVADSDAILNRLGGEGVAR